MVEGSVVVEAEKELELIVNRLKNLWQLRQSVNLEGTSYEIGDFSLRVANILLGSSYKGLLLEVRINLATHAAVRHILTMYQYRSRIDLALHPTWLPIFSANL